MEFTQWVNKPRPSPPGDPNDPTIEDMLTQKFSEAGAPELAALLASRGKRTVAGVGWESTLDALHSVFDLITFMILRTEDGKPHSLNVEDLVPFAVQLRDQAYTEWEISELTPGNSQAKSSK